MTGRSLSAANGVHELLTRKEKVFFLEYYLSRKSENFKGGESGAGMENVECSGADLFAKTGEIGVFLSISRKRNQLILRKNFFEIFSLRDPMELVYRENTQRRQIG